MPVISSHFAPRGRNTSIVQVFSYEDKRLDGALRSMRLDEEFQFTGLMQFLALMDAIIKAKPATAKGQYLRSVTVASTMGPGVKINPAILG